MNDNDVEIWKNIKNYEGIYQVSSFGNIKRIIPGGGNNAAGPLKQQKSVRKANTYLFVRLCHEGKPSMHLVHRLVAETFIDKPSYCPLCKVKFEVNHKDGNGMNNHIDNLEFCTRQENMDKSTKKRQEGCIKKLNENIIKDIKTEILKNNESNVTMAKKYNISNGTVCDIIKGRLWKHVTI